MAEWYVRPDTSHSGTRNGQSRDTAWGGWAEIVWGAAGVKPGDALYVCGVHSLTSTVQMGNHGATVADKVTISGGYGPDPGSMVVTAPGGVFFFVHRSHTTIQDLKLVANKSNGFYLYPTTGVTFQRCNLFGGDGAPIIGISAADGQAYSDLMIIDNDFVGGTGSPLGGAISWTVAASGAPISTLTRLTIRGNRFTGCDAERAVIQLRLEEGANASASMADIVVADNTFRSCPTLGVEIIALAYGQNSGLRVTGNKFYDMTNTDAAFNLGGAMGVGGFGPSLTPGFGANVIARNEGYRLTGPSGFLNTFYGTYRIFDNYGEDIVASQADGNGILVDHGCDNVLMYSNHFRRVIGNEAAENSGCGFMILDATNTTAYGNIVDGCKIGLYIGNKREVTQSSNIYNNTFKDCSYAGVLALSTAHKLGHLIRNNIFTAARAIPSVKIAGGGLTGESGNRFHGFGAASEHTLHATSLEADPQLDSYNRPQAAHCKRAGAYLGGKDFTGKHFYNPPNIGAMDEVTATPRYAVTVP